MKCKRCSITHRRNISSHERKKGARFHKNIWNLAMNQKYWQQDIIIQRKICIKFQRSIKIILKKWYNKTARMTKQKKNRKISKSNINQNIPVYKRMYVLWRETFHLWPLESNLIVWTQFGTVPIYNIEYNGLFTNWNRNLLRGSESNEVPMNSYVWVASLTFKQL